MRHAGYAIDSKIKIDYFDSEKLTAENVAEQLGGYDGIIVPGGFGDRGLEGMIQSIRYARENDVPFLGICLGMQMACIEFARDVCGLEDSNTAEVDPNAKNKIIDLMADQAEVQEMGGTQRLGIYPCKLKPGTKTAKAYGDQDVIQQRHRHRYEFNNDYKDQYEAAGMKCVGVNPESDLVEIVEIPALKWFVGTQFHPEYSSTVLNPHPLFVAFVKAAIENEKATVND